MLIKMPKAIVFDLDGTLYQDSVICYRLIDHFFADTRYARFSGELKRIMMQVLRGGHRIKCGHFVPKMPILTAECAEDFMEVPSVVGLARPNARDYFDREKYAYIGDGWSLAMYWARRAGFPEDVYWQLFRPAREDLLSPAYGPAVHTQLKGRLQSLRQAGIRLCLCSNSQARDAVEFLTKHGLESSFDRMIFDAHKPRAFRAILEGLNAEWGMENGDYLFVGDQGYSDLFEGRSLGAQTLLVSPFHVEDGVEWTYRAHTTDEMLEVLRL